MNDARPDRLTWRHQVLVLLLVAGAVALLWRLVTIQVIDHDNYRQQAALLHYGATEVPAPRGAIVEANGYPLATSIDTWDVYLDRFLWRDRERASVAAGRLGEELGISFPGTKSLLFSALNKLRRPHVARQLKEYQSDEGL